MHDLRAFIFLVLFLCFCANGDIAQDVGKKAILRYYLESPLLYVSTIENIPIPEGYVFWKKVRAKVTAYEPSYISCGKFADGKTSIMHNAWRMKGCAVWPEAIPYGTLIWIPGIGFKEADDTGSAMRRSWRKGIYHVDLRMNHPYQARKWGVKWLDVYLFRKKSP
jgi:3D (Asp-Asp-Asp) domain-containing protein